MKCSCGHSMEQEADTRTDAILALKAKLTEETIAAHMKEMHKSDEPVPTKAEVDGMIEQMIEPQA